MVPQQVSWPPCPTPRHNEPWPVLAGQMTAHITYSCVFSDPSYPHTQPAPHPKRLATGRLIGSGPHPKNVSLQ